MANCSIRPAKEQFLSKSDQQTLLHHNHIAKQEEKQTQQAFSFYKSGSKNINV